MKILIKKLPITKKSVLLMCFFACMFVFASFTKEDRLKVREWKNKWNKENGKNKSDIKSKTNFPLLSSISTHENSKFTKESPSLEELQIKSQGNNKIDYNEYLDNKNYYPSHEKEGVIGIFSDVEEDRISDNFFTINLPRFSENSQVYLEYELYGLASHHSVSRSINQHLSIGGEVIVPSAAWSHQREMLSKESIKEGLNTILFTSPSFGVKYKVKDLKIIVNHHSPKDNNFEVSSLLSGNTLYVKGLSNSDLKINNSYVLAQKGEFEKVIKLSNQEKNTGKYSITVNGKTEYFKIPSEKQSYKILNNTNYSSHTINLTKDQPTELSYEGLKLVSEKETVESAASFDILKLREKDLPAVSGGFKNVTSDKSGYRFKFKSGKLSKKIKITIPYDENKLGTVSPNEINVYSFDYTKKQWKKEPHTIVNKKSKSVTFEGDGDGDYINGIISVPESPQTSSSNPTGISGLQAINPTSAINGIEPPSANQKGSANVSYPIIIPSGRNGVQPNISVSYDSNKTNGWLGEGWDLNGLSSISLDTRWGAPKFDSTNETELYSLDGIMLVYDGSFLPHRHNDINEYSSVYTTHPQKRDSLFTGNKKKFFLRRNHDFSKIERYGSSPKEYRWVVTDPNGNKTYYGGDENQVKDEYVLKDSSDNIVHWAVWKTVDKFKNYVEYEYNKEIIQGQTGDNQNLNNGINFHIYKINYTKNDTNPSLKLYTIEFEKENTINRNDISIYAKKGVKEVEPYRLSKIYVKYDNTLIRTYLFSYKEGEFSKTLLSNIRHIDDSHDQTYNNEQTESFDFEYYNDLVEAGGSQYTNFSSDISVNASIANAFPLLPNNLLPSKIQANSTFEWGVNGRVGVGLSILTPSQNPYGHFMVSGLMGYSQAEAKNAQQLIDFNGDGIQDIIYRKPNDGLYVSAGSMASGTLTFGVPRKTINLNSNFSYTKTKTDNKGWDWGVNIWGLGYNRSNVWSTTRSTSSTFLIDANSDGLLDVLKDGEVWFNHVNSNGANELSPYSDTSENMVIVAEDALENNEKDSGLDVVKFWVAPRSGYVKFIDNISIENLPGAKAVYSVEMLNPSSALPVNGRVFLKVLHAGDTPQSINISKYNDYFYDIQQTNPVQTNNHLAINDTNYLYVNSGDKIFVRLRKNYPKDFKVFSNPEIQYVNSLNSSNFNAKDYNQDGFLLNNGSYSANYMLNNILDNLSFDNPGTVTIDVPSITFPFSTDKIGFKIIKYDVNAGTETVIYPPSSGVQFYPQSDTPFTTPAVTLVENVATGQPIKIKFKVESDTHRKFKDNNWNNIAVNYQTTIAGNSNPINVKAVAEYPSYYITDMKPQIFITSVLPPTSLVHDYYINLKKSIPGNISGDFIYIVKRGNQVIAKRKVNVVASNVTEFDLLNNQNLSYFAPAYFYTGDMPSGQFIPNGQLSLQIYCNSEQEEVFYKQFSASVGNLPFYITMNTDTTSLANLPATSINSSSFNTFSAIYNNYGQFLYDESSDLVEEKRLGGIVVNPNTPSDYFGLLINPILIKGISLPPYGNFSNCVNLPTQAEIQQCLQQNSGGYNSSNTNNIPPAVFPLYPFKNSSGVEKWMGKGLPEQYSMADSFKDDDSVSSLFNTASIDPEIIDMPVQGNVDTKMWGISRRSYNKTKTFTQSGSLIVVNLSNSESHVEGDKSVVTDDYMDMNGDGYPDVVYRSLMQLTNSTGGLGGGRSPYLTKYVSKSDNYQNSNAAQFSISGFKTAGRFLFNGESQSTTIADPSTPFADPGANFTEFKNPSADIGLEYYLDINGDGLVDRFNGNGSYSLNMGYHITGTDNFAGLNSYASKPIGAAGIGFNFNLLTQGFSFDSGVSLGFGVGFGTNFTASIGTADRVYEDLNSDGLIDILYVEGNTTKVSYNLGNKFAAPVLLYKQSSGNIDFSNEAKTYNAGASLNGHFYINIPICCLFVPLIYLKVGAQASANLGISISELDKSFKDMNGDGFPDLVISNSSGFVVNHSKIGRTNKLKTVNSVDQKNLINTFTIDYEFTKPNYNDPYAKLVMKEVKVMNPDIFSNQYLTTTPAKDIVTNFVYENSKYDRRERDNFGFEKVTVYEMDGSNVFRSHRTTYYNTGYFLNGLVSKSESFIGTSQLVSMTINNYNLYKYKDNITKININNPVSLSYDTGGTEGRKMATALLTSTETTSYEGNAYIQAFSYFTYNEKGQLEKYQSINPATTFNSEIEYHDLPSSDNILNIPSGIKVYEGTSSGTLLRSRSTEVDPSNGSLKKVFVNLDGSQDAVTQLEYNQYGNIAQVMYPENENGDIYSIAYNYDPETEKYVTSAKDILNYESKSTYDHRFDVVTQTIDATGNSTDFEYDLKGRITKILAPKEKDAGAPYTIMYEYYKKSLGFSANSNVQPMYFGSVTSHYNALNPLEPLETISIADGFGKIVQTKKDIDYNGAQRMSVSGRNVVDRFGRSIRQYHPMFEDKISSVTSTNNNRYISLNLLSTYYTQKVYDAKNRVTSDIDELLHSTFYTYELNNSLMKSTVTTTQNVSNVQIKSESFINAQGKVVKTKNYLNNQALETNFVYSTVGELLSVIDPEGIQTTYNYDLAGRRISQIHPDHGTTNYAYDPAGHLIKLYTENLQNSGNPQNYIAYYYDYNRLRKIIFPDINGNPNPSNVIYEYGDYQAGNDAGKIIHKVDSSGETFFQYGNMGEVTTEIRNVIGANIPAVTFATSFTYDSWNRILQMKYTDGEELFYDYDLGGNLKNIKNSNGYEYVKDIIYDFYEQRTSIKYGNDLKSEFTYNLADRKLNTHNLSDSNNTSLLYNNYTYDFVGNITSFGNSASPYQEMGGGYQFGYEYDQLNRLKFSNGDFSGSSAVYPISDSNFNNYLDYNNVGGITLKQQEHYQVGSMVPANTYSNQYTYFSGTHKLSSVLNINNGDQEDFDYDYNGNILSSAKSNGDVTRFAWDEMDRMKAVNQYSGDIYQYNVFDDGDDRIIKYTLAEENQLYQNGTPIDAGSFNIKDFKMYPNEYLTLDSNFNLTKHYYAGSQRVASQITHYDPTTSKQAEQPKTDDADREGDFMRYLEKTGGEAKNISTQLNILNIQPNIYYLHGDHLGTATFVTQSHGEPTQFFLNLSFGETMAEQMTGVYDNPYKFNAKELDSDTGLYYYGARFYNPKLSIWYGVDPLAEKMPSWSPYNYCFDNPVKLTDPDGRAPSPPYRWANLNVQITWYNKMIDYDNGDGTISFKGQSGYMMANDRKNCLNVINPQYALLNDLIPDQNGNYGPQTWQAIKSLDPSNQQKYKSNCYGWVLTGGLYFIDASTKEIADFLTADGYANMGTPAKGTDYKKGDMLLWDGHIIEATGQSKKGLLWQSKQGTNEVFEGTLSEVLNENSSWAVGQGSTSNATLFRPKSNSKDLIMNKKRDPIGTVKKVTNEDHQKIRRPD